MTTTENALANYTKLFDAATPTVIYQGSVWYAEAQALARELALTHNLPLEVVASGVSAFSIRQRWERNVFLITEFLNGNPVAALGTSIRIANNALTMGFDALKGQKTNSFARNIAGDLTAVTIDTWMIKAAGMDNRKGVNKTQYNELSEAVRTIAAENNMPPAVVQAIVWIQARGRAN